METIHYSRCRIIPTPSCLAVQLGLMADTSRVQIELGDYTHADDRLWMRHAGQAKGIWARALGASTRLVAFSDYECREPVYVRADSQLLSAADLRGRRIPLPYVAGRPFDVDREVYLKPLLTCLASVGLGMEDIVVIDVEFHRQKRCDEAPERPHFFEQVAQRFCDMLAHGEVDAIVTALPSSLSIESGLRRLYDSSDDSAVRARGELRTLTVSQALLDEHRDIVVDIVARLVRAETWAAQHPHQVAQQVENDLGLDADTYRVRELDYVRWSRLHCNQTDLAQLAERVQLMRDAGAVNADVDVSAWVDMSVLQDARRLANG